MEKTRKVFRFCHSLANKPFDYQFENTLTWTTIAIEHWTLGAVWMNQKCNSKWHTVVTHKTNDSVCWVTIKSHFYIFHVWIFSEKYILENRPRVKLSLGKRQRDSEGSKKEAEIKTTTKYTDRRLNVSKIKDVYCLDLLNIPQRNPQAIHFGTSSIDTKRHRTLHIESTRLIGVSIHTSIAHTPNDSQIAQNAQ